MNSEYLKAFKAWFENYAESFYSEDPVLQVGIRFKVEHTWRVCGNILRIGQSLQLGAEDLLLAETIALFHDVGRFKQFALYRTFNDRRSINHALLGVQELEEAGVLSPLDGPNRSLITKAIEYHNLYDLPQAVPDRCLFFSRLIRDADKLDIIEFFANYYTRLNTEYKDPLLESGLPDTPEISPDIVNNLLKQKNCNYSDIKNCNDRKLLQLSMIYDINFSYSLSVIDRNGYIKKICDSLPNTTETQKIYDYLQAYVSLPITHALK